MTNYDYYWQHNCDYEEIQQMEPGDTVSQKVVAIIGQRGDWAAYAGPSSWTDFEVSQKGEKISEEAAEKLFPRIGLERSYRR